MIGTLDSFMTIFRDDKSQERADCNVEVSLPKRSAIGRMWLSSVEMTQRVSQSKTDRWWSFAGSVLPAPIIGSIVGSPSLRAKCIIVTALAAALSAYFLVSAFADAAAVSKARCEVGWMPRHCERAIG